MNSRFPLHAGSWGPASVLFLMMTACGGRSTGADPGMSADQPEGDTSGKFAGPDEPAGSKTPIGNTAPHASGSNPRNVPANTATGGTASSTGPTPTLVTTSTNGGTADVAAGGAASVGSGGESGAGGTPMLSAGGASPTGNPEATGGGTGGTEPGVAECIECDEGFACFVEIDPGRCLEVCPTDVPNVILQTQAEVDALAALQCEVIGNDLTITGAEIASLAGLETLRAVKGTLVIAQTKLLENLEGLDGLRTLGALNVRENAILKEFSALAGVDAGEAGFTISKNPMLETFDGLQGFTTPANILLTDNPSIEDVSALSPERIGSLLIAGNSLPSLRFEKVHTIEQSLGFMSNTNCTALEMPALDYVGGGMTIVGNPDMAKIDLSSLTRVDGIILTGNESLTTIGGLPKLTSGGSVSITMNPMLDQCEMDDVASRIECNACGDNDGTTDCP